MCTFTRHSKTIACYTMAQSQYSFSPSAQLYVRDPRSTEVGQALLREGATLFLELGLEGFTARKLAERADTTEATVYKYFKNKHRLLQYYFQLYWMWLEQQIKVFTAVLETPEQRLIKAVEIICDIPEVAADPGVVSKGTLRELVKSEGAKAYYHVQVDKDNALRLFSPYKQLVSFVADRIAEVRPGEPFPRSLATTLVEMAHSLDFYSHHLPSLTDFPQGAPAGALKDYIVNLLIQTLHLKSPSS